MGLFRILRAFVATGSPKVGASEWNADLSYSGELPVANGGTGAATAADARTNLGAAPADNPTFTGTVTIPSPSTSDDSTKAVNSTWVRNAIANIATVAGFSVSGGAATGYIKFPSWLGSIVFQWGSSVVTFTGGLTSTSFGMTFPAIKLVQWAMSGDGGANPGGLLSIHTASGWDTSTTGIAFRCTQSNTAAAAPDGTVMRVNWLAVGY